jgi:hypothetical protein
VSSLAILPGAFDDIPSAALTRHLFIDAEPADSLSDPSNGMPLFPGVDAWAVVVRGEDRHVVGRTNDPAAAELMYNDVCGEYVPLLVATGGREACTFAAAALREFYSAAAPLSERFNRIGAADFAGSTIAALLAVLLARFGAYQFQPGNACGRRCTSIQNCRKARPALAGVQS